MIARRIRPIIAAAVAALTVLAGVATAVPAHAAAPTILGAAHVQNVGDQRPGAANPLALGTTGRGLRVEGMTLALQGAPAGSGITYRVHLQNEGWQGWRSDGAFAGSRGRSLRLEGFYAYLTGPIAEQYTLQYRAHVQDVGWQGWRNGGTEFGSFAGTQGRGLRMEQLDFRLVAKGTAPESDLMSISCTADATGYCQFPTGHFFENRRPGVRMVCMYDPATHRISCMG